MLADPEIPKYIGFRVIGEALAPRDNSTSGPILGFPSGRASPGDRASGAYKMPVHINEISLEFATDFLSCTEYRDDGYFYWTTHVNSKVKIGSRCGTQAGGYIWITFKGRKFVMHRMVWIMCNGQIPAGMKIDHINGDRTNSNISNLRLVTHSENLQNRRTAIPRSKSGLLGVVQCGKSGAWVAQIKVNSKQTHIGSYKTKEEAYDAYVAAKRKNHPKSTL